MTTQTAPEPTRECTDDDDDLTHTVCCDPTRALCGAPQYVAAQHGLPVSPDDCAVCEDLAERPCGARLCRLRTWWRDLRARR